MLFQEFHQVIFLVRILDIIVYITRVVYVKKIKLSIMLFFFKHVHFFFGLYFTYFVINSVRKLLVYIIYIRNQTQIVLDIIICASNERSNRAWGRMGASYSCYKSILWIIYVSQLGLHESRIKTTKSIALCKQEIWWKDLIILLCHLRDLYTLYMITLNHNRIFWYLSTLIFTIELIQYTFTHVGLELSRPFLNTLKVRTN